MKIPKFANVFKIMTSSKTSDSTSSPTPVSQSYYHPIPSEPQPQPQPQPPTQYVIVLPRYYHSTQWRRRITCLSSLLLLAAAAFILWPSDPEISIVRLRLDRLSVQTYPKISLDVTLDVTVKVRNRDFFSIDYNSLIVAIGYRGRQLGYVTSEGGHVKARASSFINATLELQGLGIIFDAIPLIGDLAKGEILFDTVARIGGQLGLFLFELPLQGRVSCEIIVNTYNSTIKYQNCYPE